MSLFIDAGLISGNRGVVKMHAPNFRFGMIPSAE